MMLLFFYTSDECSVGMFMTLLTLSCAKIQMPCFRHQIDVQSYRRTNILHNYQAADNSGSKINSLVEKNANFCICDCNVVGRVLHS